MCPSVSFFFSSRRRHTRWPRDWSSDVCSSDLAPECRIPWREIVSKPVSILFYSVFLSLNFTVTRAYATQVGPGTAAALDYCMRCIGVPLTFLVSPISNSLLPEIARLRSLLRVPEALRLIDRTLAL